MWLVGGLAVVVAGGLLVAMAFLEDEARRVVPSRRGTTTPAELRAPDLPIAWRGYSRGHVDALLARAATTLEDSRHYGIDPDEVTGPIGREGVDRTRGPAEPPSFLREELEDRRGEGAGGLDR